jgi:hypothetical protein
MVKAKTAKRTKKINIPLTGYFTIQEKDYFQQLKKAIKLGGIFITVITIMLFALSCYNFSEAVKLGHGSNMSVEAILRMWFKGIISGYSYSEIKIRILNLVFTAFMNFGFVAILWMFFYYIRREERLLSKCWSVINGEYIKGNNE